MCSAPIRKEQLLILKFVETSLQEKSFLNVFLFKIRSLACDVEQTGIWPWSLIKYKLKGFYFTKSEGVDISASLIS